MSAEENIKTIQRVYEAFGRGDVGTILEAVTDDVDWATDTSATGAPWFGVHHGKDGVAAFFQQFGETMEVSEFTPVTFAANESAVLTVVHFKAKSRATGKASEMNLHHYFVFTGPKISYYRGSEDTAITEATLRA
jgi:ketosteroid isomerase-like protein